MPNYYLKLFYVLMLLLLPAAGSILGFNTTAQIKCIDRERQALLNFKHGLIDFFDMLSTWRDDDNSRDCCKWKGIQCDHQTGHVTILRLRGSDTQYLRGKIPRGRHFGTFEGSSSEGNVDLCGEQLNKSCPRDGDQTTVKFPEVEAINGDEDSVFYEALYMSMGIGFFTGFWGLLGPILLWHPWRNNYIRFMNRLINYIYERL
ncbi:uncharacterized protein HKW66_Vig0117450 [Vigna angularis]|uniref:Leucine-rich repeat-containing N-terminal plant-type domain-containing protein n=1 Tax=Phaseolus angularis TaxID=3914 RepID=A0A8T0JVS4_PHAAN|nr:uncharacterized protein HKW66_Vig0117450 [Vigna angularis]